MKVKETITYPYDIVKLAKQRGITVTLLAQLMGVSRQHLHRTNKNKVVMSEAKWQLLKKILDIQ